jgi:hypothetical protein
MSEAAMTPSGRRIFWASAGAALAIHAVLLLGDGELRGGADLKPHLRLIQLMGEEPALRNVYAPTYHALGALLAPLIGLAAYPKWFGLASAAGLIAGFRAFQRAAGLPDASASLFVWAPYTFALSWCLPKVEAAGYGVAFAALALLLRRRHGALALALAATFAVHTAAGLFLGLCGLVLAASRRDGRAVAALAAGSLVASPLFAAHLAAGCDLAQAFLFSQGDYLRRGTSEIGPERALRIAVLAGPIALGASAFGARELWTRWRPIAILSGVVTALYLNELWLAPFGARTTLDLLRGLTVLAFPTAIAGGVALAQRPRAAVAVIAACALWAVGARFLTVPDSCHVKTLELTQIEKIDVDRCTFRWRLSRRLQ